MHSPQHRHLPARFRHPRIAPRLDNVQKVALYGLLAAVFASGVVWLGAEYLLPVVAGEMDPWPWKAWSMKVHGSTGMLSLFVLGTLFYGHVLLAWHQHRNRLTGAVISSAMLLLVATGLALYYVNGDLPRQWSDWLHQGVGVALPLLLWWHVARGWHSRRQVAATRKE